MKLSDLIHYKNQLEILSTVPIWNTTDMDLKKILSVVSTHNLHPEDLANHLHADHTTIHKSFEAFEHTLEQLKIEIQAQIEQAEKSWFGTSYKLYEEFVETKENIKQRKPNLCAEHQQIYYNRVVRYTGWHHAAMIIRPGFEEFINHMVSCDPLYLVDINHDLLEPSMQSFNENYQHRLRPYMVSEQHNEEILCKLPDAQFGLILAYNFFNFRPFEIIQRWMTECYQKLKPGGTLIMTFNDCDRYKAVLLVEQNYTRYTPGRMVRSWAQYLGFEELFCHHDDGPITWLELQKPGKLTSLRGGQTLAQILPNPVANSK